MCLDPSPRKALLGFDMPRTSSCSVFTDFCPFYIYKQHVFYPCRRHCTLSSWCSYTAELVGGRRGDKKGLGMEVWRLLVTVMESGQGSYLRVWGEGCAHVCCPTWFPHHLEAFQKVVDPTGSQPCVSLRISCWKGYQPQPACRGRGKQPGFSLTKLAR